MIEVVPHDGKVRLVNGRDGCLVQKKGPVQESRKEYGSIVLIVMWMGLSALGTVDRRSIELGT